MDPLIFSDFKNSKSYAIWLQDRGIVPIDIHCFNCKARSMKIQLSQEYKDGYCYRCNKCTTKKSIKYGNYLLEKHKYLTLDQILRYILIFYPEFSTLKLASKALNISFDILKELRRELNSKILQEYRQVLPSLPLLGSGEKVVEIDESQFIKGKNKKGKKKPGIWIVGMYERETRLCRFVQVEHRDANTLQEIIIRNVAKDSKLVITDGWKGYWNLKNVGYEHIKYRKFYPAQFNKKTKIHTNSIEGLWGYTKHYWTNFTNQRPETLMKFLDEIAWRKLHMFDLQEAFITILRSFSY